MIGLDTNVLVRYIAQDDAKQSPKATRIIENLSADAPGFVAIVTVVELVWVLEYSYQTKRADIVAVLERLLRIKEVVTERADLVWKSVRSYRESKADFADCLIAFCSVDAGCSEILTFDKLAAAAGGMTLID